MRKIFKKILLIILFLGLIGPFLAYFPQNSNVKALPNNYVKQKVAEGFNMPTDFARTPDGRIFILEKGGVIKVLKNGNTLATPLMSLPVNQDGERGLLGIALDPNFSNNNQFYLYYVNNNPLEIRVSKFTASGDTANPNTEQVLLRSSIPLGQLHMAGTVRVGPDDKLWITVGNNGFKANSQDLSNIHGKLLRINKDGSIPSDNPYFGNTTIKNEIYAYGLRNPFRFNFLPNGKPILGDVGDGVWEEVNVAVSGGNFGYPNSEGACSGCPYINPFYQYSHVNETASITGGFATSNNYYFGDYGKGFIKKLTVDSQFNSVISEEVFDPQAGTVVELLPGENGSFYFLTIFPGELYRVSLSSGNQAPTAKISASPEAGDAPLTVNFSSLGSSDPENSPLTYLWNFGDNTTSTQANPTHTYNSGGKYTATLTVNDGQVSSQMVSTEVSVNNLPPVPSIDSPLESVKYNAGTVISYSGSATDREDQNIPASNYSWMIVFHHGLVGDDHIHPFLGPVNGVKSGTFTIPDNGEASSDVWYEIKLTVTDSQGLKKTVSRNIYPNKSSITIGTNPAGLEVTLDGAPIKQTTNISAVVGFKFTLDAVSLQNLNGTNYQFANWSNGAGKTQTVTVSSNPQTYTANFNSTGSGSGHLRFRIQEWDGQNKWTGKFMNGVTVKLTDTQGNVVFGTSTSTFRNGGDGWVTFDNMPAGTYGILAYKNGYEGVWKQVDCNTAGGSFNNATILNANTEKYKAAFDNNAPVVANSVTVCQDLGLKPASLGNLYFKVLQAEGNEQTYRVIGGLSGATVKLTDPAGNTVLKTYTSKQASNGEEGWVFLDGVTAGNYGLMAYKSGYKGIAKQVDCAGTQQASSINNANTDGNIAAWNNNVDILAGTTVHCVDLILLNPQATTGSLRFRIQEFDGNNKWSGKFVNGATVKLTTTTGNPVIATAASSNQNGEDGWVFFDNIPANTYGILAYKNGYEGVWKQVDCNTSGGSFDNATVQNSTTENIKAAWDNHAPVSGGGVTVCQDLGLKNTTSLGSGSLRFRVQEFDGNNKWTGKFLNDVTVKLTDTAGNNVISTQNSANKNNEDGWVWFDNMPAGTYGILAYKTNMVGAWKQVDCSTAGGSFTNNTIQNSNTDNLVAAWDDKAEILPSQVTVCQDLGLKAQ